MASTNTQSNDISTDGNNVVPTDTISMATPSSPLVISNIASLIPIKLSSSNFLLWESLFEPILHGHQLMGLIEGTVPSPITPDSPWLQLFALSLSLIAEIHRRRRLSMVLRSMNPYGSSYYEGESNWLQSLNDRFLT
ncbi:hypothetical protein NE237_005291 [Protea cynaroides]|uniref:Retrotransposon Copia-like N-terminal domain-containing protein n=1 Tax=Protea cynaroides TaxID=273540 RepID=A0A9Q0QUF6_9MAGN|nr:hypothetical protein NE237_005291 [Protea cynaroides]